MDKNRSAQVADGSHSRSGSGSVENIKSVQNVRGGQSAEPVRRLLVALKQEDSELFFPDGIDLGSQPLQVHTARNREMEAGAWAQLIDTFRPEIILSGWGTPALSAAVTDSESFCAKYICHIGGTVRHLLPVELIEQGVLVSNWGNTVARAVAEHAVLLVLASARNLVHWKTVLDIPAPAQHLRTSVLGTQTLRGKRVGIHGFGGIAREVASLLEPFGVQITFYSAGVPSEALQEGGRRGAQSLAELFSSSDVLIECEALTPASRGIVTGELLELLPRGAIFVNVGRGGVIQSEATLAALAQSGRLRVAVDVATEEPVQPHQPFRQASGILLSPHIAGPTRDSYAQCGQFALANIARYVRGELPCSLVTKEMYLRST